VVVGVPEGGGSRRPPRPGRIRLRRSDQRQERGRRPHDRRADGPSGPRRATRPGTFGSRSN